MTKTPDFTLEIHRYSQPEEVFNFFHFQAEKSSSPLTFGAVLGSDPLDGKSRIDYAPSYHHHPFMEMDEEGPAYAEVSRETGVRDPERVRDFLRTERFIAHPMGALDEDFAGWVIHTQCPIEWHSGLDARESEMTDRVTVWFRDRA